MKSRTSFFNATAFKKNLLRFAPIWGIYTIFLLLVFFGMNRMTQPALLASNIAELLGGMSLINLAYAGICAFFLFGDLFNSRLCNALHAFPLRREGWLLAGVVSGILFGLVPNLLMCLIAYPILWQYAYVGFIWLAVSMLQFLFFFGMAVLCAFCAGNRLAMAAIYGIINLITMLVYVVAELIYQPLLPGVRLNEKAFFRFFPISELVTGKYFKYEYWWANETFHYQGMISGDWVYLGICAGFGVVFLGLAWLVYRRRHLETAGDFISLRPLRPVFLVIASVGAGALLYMFSKIFGSKSVVFLIAGLILGYFSGQMLLNRTLRVFGKKSLIGLTALLVVVASSMGLTKLDPLGITTKIPDSDDIQWACVSESGYDREYLNIIYLEDDYLYKATDAATISQIRELHQLIISSGQDTDESPRTCSVNIRYMLKNGKTITRYYTVAADSPAGKLAEKYYGSMNYLFRTDDIASCYQAYSEVYVDSRKNVMDRWNFTNGEIIAGLLDAIKADCEAGTMAQQWAFRENKEAVYTIDFFKGNHDHINDPYFANVSITVFSNNTNTLAYLKSILNPENSVPATK